MEEEEMEKPIRDRFADSSKYLEALEKYVVYLEKQVEYWKEEYDDAKYEAMGDDL